MLGRHDSNPLPPQNLLADFAGGGLLCALGIVIALFERQRSNKGQIIDASMVEGAAYVGSFVYKSRDLPVWSGTRGKSWYLVIFGFKGLVFCYVNQLAVSHERFDGGIHNYETYATKDGHYMSVGALEPQFYQELVNRLTEAGIKDVPRHFPDDPEAAKKRMGEIFLLKTRSEWESIFDGTDACVTPVLSLDEAPTHPHNAARGSFMKNDNGQHDPAPAPILSRTPAVTKSSNLLEPEIGGNSVSILEQLGYNREEIDRLIKTRAVYQKPSSTSKL